MFPLELERNQVMMFGHFKGICHLLSAMLHHFSLRVICKNVGACLVGVGPDSMCILRAEGVDKSIVKQQDEK